MATEDVLKDSGRANEMLPVWTPEDRAKDGALENKLILLLASLEQMRVKLGSRPAQKDPLLAVQLLADLANRAAQFYETEFWATEIRLAGEGKTTLELIRAETESAYPLARLLEVRNHRLSLAAIAKLDSNAEGEPDRRRENLRQVTRALLRILEQYLRRFLASLQTPTARVECEDAVNIFMTDLTNMVERLSF